MSALAASVGRIIVNSYAQDSRHKAHLFIDFALYTINTTSLLTAAFLPRNRNKRCTVLKNIFKFSLITLPIIGPDFCKSVTGPSGKWLSILRAYITLCGIAATYGILGLISSEDN